jgi:hypothetical protein
MVHLSSSSTPEKSDSNHFRTELISREGARSTLGLGSRLAILEAQLANSIAIQRNTLLRRAHQRIHPVTAITPASRLKVEREREALLRRQKKGGKEDTKERDPTMLVRAEEKWEVCEGFPLTVAEFWALRREEGKVVRLCEYYGVKVFAPELGRPLDLRREGVMRMHMEACLEELAVAWGIDYERIARTMEGNNANASWSSNGFAGPSMTYRMGPPPSASTSPGPQQTYTGARYVPHSHSPGPVPMVDERRRPTQ